MWEIFASVYGARGELYQPHCEGQEDQLSTIDLVVSIDRAVGHLPHEHCAGPGAQQGLSVHDDSRLFPFDHEYINILARYWFSVPATFRAMSCGHCGPQVSSEFTDTCPPQDSEFAGQRHTTELAIDLQLADTKHVGLISVRDKGPGRSLIFQKLGKRGPVLAECRSDIVAAATQI